MFGPDIFSYGAEVGAALEHGGAVVALESTVIAHGLPRPHNLHTARRLEEIVRAAGATPATVAVLGGQVRVGLNAEELQHLAENGEVRKASRRDLPVAVARRWDAATTVATTAWAARRAGLEVFATGGIGGVHRGATMDISADLPELARTPLVVVCSGAKIVLDLEATREWLETHGVTVVGFGCDEMPAFYSRSSGLPVDVRVETVEEIAALAHARRALGTEAALLVTVPVPAEAEMTGEWLQKTLDDALREAQLAKITGRALTPFLLGRMAEHSGGATLRANISLLENNAQVAAQIARSLKQSDIYRSK